MKNIFAILIGAFLALNVKAQHGHITGAYISHAPVYVYRPAFGVGFFSPFYSPFGFYGYPFVGYGYPFVGYPYGMNYYKPSQLQQKEADIRSDYEDRIYSVRQDSTLTNKQKREEVRSLKKQRDQEIKDLVANYHKQPVSSGGSSN